MAPDTELQQGVPHQGPGGGDVVLWLDRLSAGYGRRAVVHEVSLHVDRGEVVSLLGHNGAGKTTILKTILGIMKPTAGEVLFCSEHCSARSHSENVQAGMSFTPAEAAVFADLTVLDNLELGGFTVADATARKIRMEKIFDTFPILRDRVKQSAGTLSGGEQRMLSMGIALMSEPSLMLLDEPSLGLTPALAQRVLEMVRVLAEEDGMSVLVVEQNVRAALRVSSRAYFIRTGRIILEERADVALARSHWWDLF